MNLHLDIETYSSADLRRSGVYRYAEDAEVLLLAWALDDDPVQIADLTSAPIPRVVLQMLEDPLVTKWSHNANFERTLLDTVLGIQCPPEQWRCTAAWGLSLGLPAALGDMSRALGLEHAKDPKGAALIRYFSMPCRATKVNGMRQRNLPEHDPVRWEQFKAYCLQDVEVERAIHRALSAHPLRPVDWKVWELDQKINDLGVSVDLELVDSALVVDAQARDRLHAEAASLLPAGTNANSVSQLKAWLEEETGVEVTELTKKTVKEMLKGMPDAAPKRVLQIRQELAKSSVAKYAAIRSSVGSDGRVRGLFQFSGAARTGRWAGRLVQVHNLPQNHLPALADMRELLRKRDIDALGVLHDNVQSVLSQLLRTVFVPSGQQFTVVDFSAVEARFLAWLAGEDWRMDIFRSHGRIYEASAARMFGVPIEKVTKGSALRQRGKVAELALGYGGGDNALVTMGALEMGLKPDELGPIKDAWRKANPAIVRLWRDMEEAAAQATIERREAKVNERIAFRRDGDGPLRMVLPSGRELVYWAPEIAEGPWFGQSLTFMGVEPMTGNWSRLKTFGGRLVENACQAGCADILREALLELDRRGRRIVMHVHDEVVLDDDRGLADAVEVFGTSPSWAPDLPLRGDGFETPFYCKED